MRAIYGVFETETETALRELMLRVERLEQLMERTYEG